MSSKGIDAYIYLSSNAFNVNVHSRDLRTPANVTFESDPAYSHVGRMWHGHYEIDSKDLGAEKSGLFGMVAFHNGRELLNTATEINPYSGGIVKSGVHIMMQTPSRMSPSCAVNFGFADAGISRSHQAWVYLTDNYERWMESVLRDQPKLRDAPLSTFVLPGSHDAGMLLDLENPGEGLSHAMNLAVRLGMETLGSLGNLAARVLMNLGNTQKESITAQLQLGVRFFDFRPGRLQPDQIRHWHNFVPGLGLEPFIRDILQFLQANTQEIVIVNLKHNGIHDNINRPTSTELDGEVGQIVNAHYGSLKVGDVSSLQKSTKSLIDSGTRLIVLHGDGDCHDSYSDAYKTPEPSPILAAIESTMANTAQMKAKNWTLLQLQGTNADWKAIVDSSVFTFLKDSHASSPLLYTKARFDHVTYPWLVNEANVAKRAQDKLVVIQNDFADNALTSHAYAMTKQRAARL